MTHDSRRFLPPDAIARIARLEVQARQVVEGFLSGRHRSPFFGQSIEFAQHREYTPGDDTRRIDWKVWSKTDRYYIKQYEEETNLRTLLLLDASESMQFGSPTKFEFACQIAACLSYLLLRQQDAVGMITFDQQVRHQVETSSKQNHLNAILSALHAESPQKKTDLLDILTHVADQRSKRGLIVLISDLFANPESLFKGLGLLRTRGHDVMLFHVLDHQELEFDYSGTTKFEGMEELGDLICDPRSLRDGYLEAINGFIDDIRRKCARQRIDYQVIRTTDHLDAALSYYLTHRVGMRQTART